MDTEHETHIAAIVQASGRIEGRPILLEQVNQLIKHRVVKRFYILDNEDYGLSAGIGVLEDLLDA